MMLSVKEVNGPKGKGLKLTEDFMFPLWNGHEAWIPKGLWYDEASGPSLTRIYLGKKPQPKYALPALKHDMGYLGHPYGHSASARKMIDEEFREDLKKPHEVIYQSKKDLIRVHHHALKTRKSQAWVMYKAVRLFGGSHFKQGLNHCRDLWEILRSPAA